MPRHRKLSDHPSPTPEHDEAERLTTILRWRRIDGDLGAGTIARITGGREPAESLRLILQQAFRELQDGEGHTIAHHTTMALYAQLTGVEDARACVEITAASYWPEIEGEALIDKRLTKKARAELRRRTLLP